MKLPLRLPLRLLFRILLRFTLRNFLVWITLVSWGLWFGGTIATFVFVKHLFAVFPHDVAGASANAIFQIFAKYELTLAGVILVSSGVLLVTSPSPGWVLVLACVVLAGGMAVTVALGLMPLMESLISEGRQHSPDFIKLHVKSMIAMTLQAFVLLIISALTVLTLDPPKKAVVDGEEFADAAHNKHAELSQRV